MRTFAQFAALPALALALAACGGDADVADDGTETAVAPVPANYPAVATDARSSVDWMGTYEQRNSDGRNRTLTLAQGDNYTMTDADGIETTGMFNWYSDNSRILIKEDGEDMVFALANGAIYSLSGPEASVDGPFTEDQTWRESVNIAR